jgi:hypothetical protein
MDALKLFYETTIDAKRGRPGERAAQAAQARPAEAANGPEMLLRHLEQRAGKPLRSRAAIDAYLASLPAAQEQRPAAGRSLLRETLLVLFLMIAVLQYYYMDVSLEIAALNRITVFVPVQALPPPAERS